MDFPNQNFLIVGVANKKSVAYHIATLLQNAGANVILSVKDDATYAQVAKLFPASLICICDVEKSAEIESLPEKIRGRYHELHGIVHSIAFANYSARPFHETPQDDFLQAVNISCFSLIAIANACKNLLTPDASVITISISSTRIAAATYGYMAPIKAALDSSVIFLAKSFAEFSRVRFNSVNAGPLKTSASAGIPNYINNYLFAEKLTLRQQNLSTDEVANLAVFLLSPLSSGINAQNIVIDAGMGVNIFAEAVVAKCSE